MMRVLRSILFRWCPSYRRALILRRLRESDPNGRQR